MCLQDEFLLTANGRIQEAESSRNQLQAPRETRERHKPHPADRTVAKCILFLPGL